MKSFIRFRFLLLIAFLLVGLGFSQPVFARDFCTYVDGACGNSSCGPGKACIHYNGDTVCSTSSEGSNAAGRVRCDYNVPECTPSNSCGSTGCGPDQKCVSEWFADPFCVQASECGIPTNEACSGPNDFCKDPSLRCQPVGSGGYVCGTCASSPGPGLPAACGGNNPPTSPLCCGSSGGGVCQPIYSTGSGCAVAPAQECLGKNMGGGICWEDSQCAADGPNSCAVGAGNVKRCKDAHIAKGGVCSGVNDCRCVSGTECLNPDGSGFKCQDPDDLCLAPDATCSPGGKECCDVGTTTYKCTQLGSAAPKCLADGNCIPVTGSCLAGSGHVPCCQPAGHTVTCDSTGGPTGRCTDHSVCKNLGQTCNNDCCNGLRCDSGNCVVDDTGNECTGSSCDQCNPGFACANGHCTKDPRCDLTIPYSAYTGPIIDFQDLLSALYFALYPVGIGLGLAFIIKAGYTLMTSEGNPQLVQQGQEELTAAVLGTFFILLSVTILRIIIKQILGSQVGF